MHIRVFRRRAYPRTYSIDVRLPLTYVRYRRTYSTDVRMLSTNVRDSAMDDFGTTQSNLRIRDNAFGARIRDYAVEKSWIRDYAEHSGSEDEDRRPLVLGLRIVTKITLTLSLYI